MRGSPRESVEGSGNGASKGTALASPKKDKKKKKSWGSDDHVPSLLVGHRSKCFDTVRWSSSGQNDAKVGLETS